MSPRRRVAITTAVFAAIGVGISVGIIAAGGGFSEGPGPSILDPPSQDDIWVVGENIGNGTALRYSLTATSETASLESSVVSLVFLQDGENWRTTITISNGTETVEQTVIMSKELTREGQLDASFRPYFELLQSSIFAVRDMEYGESPKYLVVGAPWNQIFYKSSQVIARITSEETVETQQGAFDSFVLTYSLAEKKSSIWIVRDLPLPVKAEVYDTDDKLQYRYELQELSGPVPGSTGAQGDKL